MHRIPISWDTHDVFEWQVFSAPQFCPNSLSFSSREVSLYKKKSILCSHLSLVHAGASPIRFLVGEFEVKALVLTREGRGTGNMVYNNARPVHLAHSWPCGSGIFICLARGHPSMKTYGTRPVRHATLLFVQSSDLIRTRWSFCTLDLDSNYTLILTV
jgi:hypothetical protein